MHMEKLSRMKSSRSIRSEYRQLLKSHEWHKCAKEKIEEAGNQCWNCGSQDHLDVHHLTYRDVLPWEYSSDELRVLCRTCHESVHHVADLVWVECLRFEPHILELLLKRLRSAKDSGEEQINIVQIIRKLLNP